MIGIPDAPGWILGESCSFPERRWNGPLTFPIPNTGWRAKTKKTHVLLNSCNPKTFLIFVTTAYFIKIDVRGNSEGVTHIYIAVSLPVFKNALLGFVVWIWNRN